MVLILVFCALGSTPVGVARAADTTDYTVRQVDVYRDVVPDSTLPLRYYAAHPAVPYVGVRPYFERFFDAVLEHTVQGHVHRYTRDKAYMEVDATAGIIVWHDVGTLTAHGGFAEANCRTFWQEQSTSTPLHAKIINLRDYGIDVYAEGDEVYLPLTLLGNFAGGTAQYNVVYNGQSVYVLDMCGELSPTPRDVAYYGPSYHHPMERARTPDMAQYAYRLLCLSVDQARGYTRQTLLGDDNLLTLGLDGTLETYYPHLKQMLLSTSAKTYHLGLTALFAGLWDGGHTCIVDGAVCNHSALAEVAAHPELRPTVRAMLQSAVDKQRAKEACARARQWAWGVAPTQHTYYHCASGVAYVGWDAFEVDYRGWDAYYRGEGKVPTDTYAFVRNALEQARTDGAKHVVLDLACNGGGDTLALLGVLALVGDARGTMWVNDVMHRSRTAVGGLADVNLDGCFDEADAMACRRDYDVSVLTSRYSFSCGNLLPALLQGAGCKTIGERTGGGGCAITLEATADGVVYVRSSHLCLCDARGRGIDEGVEPDVPMPYALCYDPAQVAEALEST